MRIPRADENQTPRTPTPTRESAFRNPPAQTSTQAELQCPLTPTAVVSKLELPENRPRNFANLSRDEDVDTPKYRAQHPARRIGGRPSRPPRPIRPPQSGFARP